MNFKKKFFPLWINCYLYNNKYILFLRRKRSPIYDCVLAISVPYIIFRWLFLLVYEKAWGIYSIQRKMFAERNMDFKYEMAAVAISKNEGPYIREWLEYHKIVGFQKFFIYDNESSDDTKQVLQPYIETGLVEYTYIQGKARQLDAYNDAINKHKHECRWMAFFDMDEFIMPTTPFRPIVEIISEIVYNSGRGACGVGINWALYGSSHLLKRVPGLVMDNFIYRAEITHWSSVLVKTICNPRMVVDYISPHYPLYKIGGYSVGESDGKRQYGWYHHNVAYKNVRVNHYFTKSKQEYIKKHNRGLADRIGKYDDLMFEKHDLNDIKDEAMKVYSSKIRHNLEHGE